MQRVHSLINKERQWKCLQMVTFSCVILDYWRGRGTPKWRVQVFSKWFGENMYIASFCCGSIYLPCGTGWDDDPHDPYGQKGFMADNFNNFIGGGLSTIFESWLTKYDKMMLEELTWIHHESLLTTCKVSGFQARRIFVRAFRISLILRHFYLY